MVDQLQQKKKKDKPVTNIAKSWLSSAYVYLIESVFNGKKWWNIKTLIVKANECK